MVNRIKNYINRRKIAKENFAIWEYCKDTPKNTYEHNMMLLGLDQSICRDQVKENPFMLQS